MKTGIRTGLIVIASCLLLGGCGGKKAQDLPEDTPWNHGVYAVMETEEGYYTNETALVSYSPSCMQTLLYVEKKSGTVIPLCDKPECSHEGGDNCEATYKNMKPIHTTLYDGFLYVLGAKQEGTKVSIDLYRGALDGSALDKVGCVIEADNVNQQSISYHPLTDGFYALSQQADYGFILHKGYAYVPYFLQIGSGEMGLQGGGLCRMNLNTGEKEQIYETENLTDAVPCRLTGVGDYVYFSLCSIRTGQKTRRYVISKKEVEKLTKSEEEREQMLLLFQPGRYYSVVDADYGTVQGVYVYAYDAETKESIEEESFMVNPRGEEKDLSGLKEVLLYDHKFFVCFQAKTFVYDEKGELIATLESPGEDLIGVKLRSKSWSSSAGNILYKISHDKLYFIMNSSAYSCPLEDLYQGKGTWELAYIVNIRYYGLP